MDAFVASEPAASRQSILGNLLRGRPRGTSQSQSQSQQSQSQPQHQLQQDHHSPALRRDPSPAQARRSPSATRRSSTTNNPAVSPGPTHRRRGPGGSGTIAQPTPPQAGAGTFQMLRRRRSASGVANTPPSAPAPAVSRPATSGGPNPTPSSTQTAIITPGQGLGLGLGLGLGAVPASAPATHSTTNTNTNTTAMPPPASANPSPATAPAAAASSPSPGGPAATHRIRLVPHLDATRTLHFVPIQRDVKEGDPALRIGRFTDRATNPAPVNSSSNKLAFKSKVVSRAHAEIWCEHGPRFFIRDTKSSSGTFLNHIRLSPPNSESKPFPIKDGDILQLGVDYQGGTEDIYKCVRIRIEMGREWQTAPNAFNTNAMNQLKVLAGAPPGTPGKKNTAHIADCCICLFQVSLHQSLFIAPCSHVFHYKCLRPLLTMHHPGFTCPLCRTFANLDEDVELEPSADSAFEAAESAALGFPTPSNEEDALQLALALSTAAANAATGNHGADGARAPLSPMGAGAETEVESEHNHNHNHNHTRSLPRLGSASATAGRSVSGTLTASRFTAAGAPRTSLGEFGGTVIGLPEDDDDDEDDEDEEDEDEEMIDVDRLTNGSLSPPPSANAVTPVTSLPPLRHGHGHGHVHGYPQRLSVSTGDAGLEALLAMHASTSARMEAEHGHGGVGSGSGSGSGSGEDGSEEGLVGGTVVGAKR